MLAAVLEVLAAALLTPLTNRLGSSRWWVISRTVRTVVYLLVVAAGLAVSLPLLFRVDSEQLSDDTWLAYCVAGFGGPLLAAPVVLVGINAAVRRTRQVPPRNGYSPRHRAP